MIEIFGSATCRSKLLDRSSKLDQVLLPQTLTCSLIVASHFLYHWLLAGKQVCKPFFSLSSQLSQLVHPHPPFQCPAMSTLSLNNSSTEVALPATEPFGDAVETPGSDRPVRALSLGMFCMRVIWAATRFLFSRALSDCRFEDGGGIRGISSILILKEIMRHVNKGRADELQPWQVFDLIGGTSTGGIIAIMLGCLHMTLDDCLCAYTELSKSIFKPKRSKYNLLSRFLDLVSAKERYDSAKMERLARAIIEHRTGSAHSRLQSQDSSCKVYVPLELFCYSLVETSPSGVSSIASAYFLCRRVQEHHFNIA